MLHRHITVRSASGLDPTPLSLTGIRLDSITSSAYLSPYISLSAYCLRSVSGSYCACFMRFGRTGIHRLALLPQFRRTVPPLPRLYWKRVSTLEKMEIQLTAQEDELCTLLDQCTRAMKEAEGVQTSCRIAGGWVRDKVCVIDPSPISIVATSSLPSCALVAGLSMQRYRHRT